MKLEQIIIDADICIKLGGNAKYRFLEIVVPALANRAYIHETVYDEIKMPASAIEQVNTLVETGDLEKISEEELDHTEKNNYKAIYSSLASVMMNPDTPNKNAGEVSSLAIAKVKGITYFGTDERDLQPIIDRKLNTGLKDIRCIRIIDIVKMFKDHDIVGLKRKEVKALWKLSGKSPKLFDEEI